jgi:putative MATE family efflux protein
MFSRKDLVKLIIPLIIEQTLAVTVGMADGMMVARVGEAAVSGVSLVDSINLLLIGLFGAMATGGAVVSAQFLGQKKSDSACKSGEQLILSSFMLSLFIMLITLLGRSAMLKLLFGSVEAEVMDYALTYIFFTALSFPFIAVYNACAALFRSMGNSKITMIIAIIMNIINIVGNAILIFGMGWGVAGAAIATLASRIFAAVTLMFLLRKKELPIHIGDIAGFKPDKDMIKRILKIGIPNGMENSVFQVGKILVQGIIATLGTTSITANAIAAAISGLCVLPGSAVGLALITVVGQCVGAGDFKAVKMYTYKLMKAVYLIMAALSVLILVLIPAIIGIYDVSGETAKLSAELLTYYCIMAALLWPIAFALPNALRAANDVKFTMVVSIASMWIWRIGFSYVLVLVFGLGVLGVYIAMSIDWLCRSIFFFTRFRREGYRKHTHT